MRKFIAIVCLLLLSNCAFALKYKLFLVTGQSNAVGADSDSADLPPSSIDQNIPFFFDTGRPDYDAGQYDSSSMGQWTTLQAQPLGNPPSPDLYNFKHGVGGFGPEMGIGRELYSSGMQNIAIVKFAYNSTYIELDWLGTQRYKLYGDMVTRTKEAISLLETQGHTVDVSGMFWVQGENDSGLAGYDDHYKQLIDQCRADFNSPEMAFVSTVKTSHTPTTWTVARDQHDVAAKDNNVAYIDSSHIDSYNFAHFSSAGQIQLGTQMAETYLDIVAEQSAARVINVVNHDFEDNAPIAIDADVSEVVKIIPGWNKINGHDYSAIDFGDTSRWYSKDKILSANGTDGEIGYMDGRTTVYAHGSLTGNDISGFSQLVDETLAEDTLYRLNVAVGYRDEDAANYGLWKIQLLADGQALAQTDAAETLIPMGTFGDAEVEFLMTEEYAHLLGQQIEIRLLLDNADGETSTYADFDNVRLVAIDVPEPATIAMFFVGVTALIRRKK